MSSRKCGTRKPLRLTEQEDVSTNVIVTELLEPLKEAQSGIIAALSGSNQTETTMNSLLDLNEEILKLQETYSSLLKKPTSPPMPKAAPTTSNKVPTRDDTPIPTLPPPKQPAVSGGKLPVLEGELDEFDLIARRTPKMPSALPVVSAAPTATSAVSLPSFVPDFGSGSSTPILAQPFDPFSAVTALPAPQVPTASTQPSSFPSSAFPFPSTYTPSSTLSAWPSTFQPSQSFSTISPAPGKFLARS